MPLAVSRLEILQVRKLIQCVRVKDSLQVAKMAELGIEGLLNYQGKVVSEFVVSPAGLARGPRVSSDPD